MNIHSEHPPTAPCDHDECGPKQCKLARRYIKDLMRYICDTPELLSLLYDLDLLPEQLEEGSKDYGRMLLITDAWRHEHKAKVKK